MSSIESILRENKAEVLILNDNFGVGRMIANNKKNELGQIYKLMKRITKTIEHIADKLQKYIEQQGRNLRNDSKLNQIAFTYINKVLAIKNESDEII